jgi:hypothetical protein
MVQFSPGFSLGGVNTVTRGRLTLPAPRIAHRVEPVRLILLVQVQIGMQCLRIMGIVIGHSAKHVCDYLIPMVVAWQERPTAVPLTPDMISVKP